jgi:anaphase-promoting complex subunit 10
MYATAPSSQESDGPPRPREPPPAPSANEEGDDPEEEEGAEGGGAPTAAAAATEEGLSSLPHHKIITAVPTLDRLYGLREMGREALCWQLSSAKPGNGVDQIRDAHVETYWQSDGIQQPHWIQVHFGRRVAISHVCLYLDYHLDESYTPKRIQVMAGMTSQDLTVAWHPSHVQVELQEPVGWCILPLSSPPDPLDPPPSSSTLNLEVKEDENFPLDACYDEYGYAYDSYNSRRLVRAHLIRICILSMHQNGRDTHVRQVQLYGPRLPTEAPVWRRPISEDEQSGETKEEVSQGIQLDESWEDDFQGLSLSSYGVIR